MRLRQLVLACGLSSLMLSQYASALGLGEMTLKSALNQPLEAEIKLLDTRDLSAEQILVALASPADFERNGVDRLYFYTEFQFDVRLDTPDGPKVVVTSRSPVREPYLNFLIEARWTAGRLLREYTLLMDLPTFDDAAPKAAINTAATQAPVAQKPAAAPSRQATSPRPTQAAPATRPAVSRSISGNEYQIKANDTLWNIARDVGASSGASIHQAMMALYEANPEAFINGNINLLRRGQVLRIPSSEEMTSRSTGEAVRQFAAQTGDASLGAQLNASRRTTSANTASTQTSGRVKLVAPGGGTGSAGQGSGANRGSGAGLEAELAVTLEELDKSKAENTELSSRVRDLEAQIDTMERLVEVSNEKLRAMQLAAEQTQQAQVTAPTSTEQPPASTETAATPAVTAPAVSTEPETPATAPVAASSEAASSKAASSAAAVKPARVVSPPPPSLVDTAIQNAPWIGLGVLILGAGGYFFYRRRKEQQEEAEANDAFDQDVFAMDSSIEDEELLEDSIAETALHDEQESDFELDLDAGTDHQDADDDVSVIDKADIHIAYGQLDKAEELLLKGLEKDPGSADIRLKLLEVYSHQRDVPSFDKHYAALAAIGGAAVLARASELRAAIPGASEFEVELPEAVDSPVEQSLNFDDLNFDDLHADDQPAATPAAVDLADDSLDFNLDLDDDLLSLDDPQPEPEPAQSWDLPEELSSSSDLGEFSLDVEPASDPEPASGVESGTAVDDGEFDVQLDADLPAPALDPQDTLGESLSLEPEVEAEDLSELSLALDGLDDEALPDDLSAANLALDDEFSFDLEEPETPAVPADVQDLDVTADDFNLDMDVNDVDLAALDHEMEALDNDQDFSSLDHELTSLDSAFDADDLNVPSSGLNLTDDLDKPAQPDAIDEEFLDEALVDAAAPVVDTSPAELPHDDDVFAEALSELDAGGDIDLDKLAPENFEITDEDMDAELDFLADADEAATKLDLARAYIDMGDAEGAKDILAEVVNEGNDDQRAEAQDLLSRIDA
ncbi:FimV/HubP family polar landmark protein [Cellvibrio japonicus]|uniref:LysM domain-containing protein n=1 Tax=Cellvibrio japonicus (strain Ueda107) TaxID=498211 RepID=B3PFN6_CELJU|nr:FimV/HubP family polar landmark protein [Cellvibrio japonicus]ACE84274.1 conserved hypothetical protein [Cellvibrio japonicus Ueda107]QEI12262.1 LPXTG cell wall anchor domain-containing protein [Cellvibrio japonicus]QEI15836.1 LPXTG cell wall anchor domain-containing protein [Cellvibrio japonicus]QEI19414.1 LPXTG cell wall anchor domain-containing protein [Cellvibrio japonicus]